MLNLRHISLAAVFVLTTGMTGCNDNTNTTVAKSNAPAEANLPTETVNRAVATIKAYIADSTKIALTVEDYTNAGITGVNATNVATVNDALKTLALQSYPKARAKIQAIVTPGDTTPGNTELGATATKIAMSVIATYALDNTKTAPTPTDYTNAGIRGVTATNVASVNAQLDNLVSLFTDDVVTKVQAVVDTTEILKKIGNEHQDHNATITVAQLKAITPSLENINDDYENIYRTYIASADTNISSPATRAEVQQMITEVQNLNLPTNAILDRSFFKKTNGAFEHRFVYLPVENTTTGRTWLNNNLGADYANVDSSAYNASQQATARNDYKAYGSFFQWGRKADGHELMNWVTDHNGTRKYGETNTTNDNPSDSLFIKQRNWRVTPDDTLWASESSANNVCPVGYRLPLNPNGAVDAENELAVEINSWDSKDANGSMSSDLKLPTAGGLTTGGVITWWTPGYGIYWTGSVVPSDGNNSTVSNARDVYFGNALGLLDTSGRGYGFSVRCIKDQTPAERSVSILKEIGNEHSSNNKSTITVAQLKAILPVLRDINDDYQDSYRSYIASADSNFSSPATRDEVQQMINEVNRLVPVSDATLADIATQHSSHKSTLTVAKLKAITPALENIEETNEKWYQGYIEGSDTNISSPATIEELQHMIDEVNSFNLPDNAILDKNFFKKTRGKFEHRFVYLPVTNSNTGRTWLNNNLGAWYANVGRNIYNPSQQATNANDNYAKGSLFQWGRKADGHELVTRWWGNGTIDQLATTTTKSDNPTDGKFIAVNSDWRVHPNGDLWKGIDAPNNPCPAHYRVPTKKELDVEAQTWNALTADGSMSSRLKIPGPGWLGSNGYGMYYPGGAPRIWDTTPGVAWRPHETQSLERTNGLPLRCIKEQTPAERSDNILKEIGNEHSSNKSTVTVEDLKAITPALENINDDYESSYRTYISNPSNYFSSPATKDEVQSMINEVNRLVSVSEATRTLIATQHSNGSSNITVAQLKAINLLNNIQDNNEKWYQSYIEGSDTHFSSPATIEELQSMIDEVNSFNLPDNAILDKNFYKKTHNKFEHRFVYLPVTNSETGRTWLNNNLGAWYANVGRNIYNPSQQATNANDNYAKGSLFQWGRKADGHELVTRWWGNGTIDQLATTTTKSDNPTDGKFIAVNSDWRVHPNDDLWKGIDAPNNPCPAHYRVPTKKELDIEAQTWNSLTADGSMSSLLKIPGPGWLNSNGYGMFYPGGAPRIWDTTPGVAWRPHETHSLQRTNGLPLRCIKEQTPAERSASILKEIGNEHSSNKSIITIEDLKAITPALENINDDYENIYQRYIANADKSFSSPATKDEVQSMINEVNRLVPASEATRTLIATQHSNGSSNITVAQLKAIDLLNNIQDNNEKWYQGYIEATDTNISSPATIEELQSMIDEVNSFNLPANAVLDKNFYKKTHNKFEHRFVYLPVTNSNTGRTWLNNNLGAWYANVGRNIYNPSQQATNANDNYAKGSLFQWGRKADGHELVTRWWGNGTIDQLATTTTKSDNPTDGKFIAVNSDWRVHPNDNLWKGIDAPNNPCPAHYRVPTKKELDIEAQTWNALTADGSMSSRLKIPGPGWLNSNGYGMFYPGGAPRIWDTTPGVAWRPHETHSIQRTNGQPLRCIKEQTPAERSDNILKEIGNQHSSGKSTITIAQLKAITPALDNINSNYENIYRTYIANAGSNFFSLPATRDEVQRMINIVNDNRIYELGSYDTAGNAKGATLSHDGTKAYIADYTNGLVIVDISDPARPTKLGSYNTTGIAWGVTLSNDGTKAYVADYENGLVIVDISDPVHPTKLGSVNTSGAAKSVTLSSDGSKAYLADWDHGVVIVDISNPALPRKIASYDTGTALNIALSSDGTKAYIADWENSLVILDISDPYNPIKLSSYHTSGYLQSVTLSSDGTKAYLSDDANGLVIVDISDPAHLTKLGLYDTAGHTEDVTLSSNGQKAYIADWENGLVIVDISDPTHPIKLNSYDTAGYALDITLSSDGTKAYIADGENGLVIVGIK